MCDIAVLLTVSLVVIQLSGIRTLFPIPNQESDWHNDPPASPLCSKPRNLRLLFVKCKIELLCLGTLPTVIFIFFLVVVEQSKGAEGENAERQIRKSGGSVQKSRITL